ncbi:MAG TPA: 4-hydroxythreonine-4-phosphate dehydrogenase PdxA, partial [Bacteroidales bacterium]|nr:4-hydroxythreonine-4-phosphate dehydrogenase PdxA [Bacteroidales bacterium]
MSREKRFRLGITHGDVNGIGYEVILKALSDQRMYDNIIPVVYGSTKVASYHRKTLRNCDVNFQGIRHLDEATNKRVNILNITDQEIRVELGFPSEEAGRMAVLSLEMALKDLREGHLEAIVTAPFDKHTVQSA